MPTDAQSGYTFAKAPAKQRAPRKPPRHLQPAGSPFGPLRRADAPITTARRVAHQRVQRATRAVERNTVVPYVPKISHPTTAQRHAAWQAARTTYLQGIHSRAQINALPAAQRQRVNRALGYQQTAKRNTQIRVAESQPQAPHLPPGYKLENGQILQRARNPYTGNVDWLEASTFHNGPLGTARTLQDVTPQIKQRGERLYQRNVVTPARQAFADRLEHIQTHIPAAQQPLQVRRLVRQFFGPTPRHPRRELARQGRAIVRANRSQIRPGDRHSRVQALGVNLDVSRLATAVSDAIGHGAEGNFVRNAGNDVLGLGAAPFLGAYELGAGTYEALGHGDTRRLGRLVGGVWKGIRDSAPGELVQGNPDAAVREIRQHPVYEALNLAAGASAVGRTAGGLARGFGTTAEEDGLRGALARAGTTVRPPLALVDDPGAVKGGLYSERTFSKDYGRKRLQQAADARREPLLDANGRIVTVMQRGRRVPVLKARPAEREKLLGGSGSPRSSRGDVLAGRTNARERLAREEAQAPQRVTIRHRAVNEIVSLYETGVIRSAKTFREDLAKERRAIEDALEKGGHRHTEEIATVQARLALVTRAEHDLRGPRGDELIRRIVASADTHSGHLNELEREAVALKLLDPASARRAKLFEWAQSHMSARPVSVEEHARLEKAALAEEQKARAHLESVSTGPGRQSLEVRQAAKADLARARQRRIAVSGRNPRGVVAHERTRLAAAAAEREAKRLEVDVARLERSRQRLIGSQARARANGLDTARGAKAMRQVEGQIQTARARAGEARTRARQAAHDARTTPMPDILPGLRKADGTFLANREIEQDILRHRGANGLDTIAYLPQRLDARGARAFHTQFRVESRPNLNKEPRTGDLFARRGVQAGRRVSHEEAVHKATQIAKAQQIDRAIGEHVLRHPAWGKAQRGEALTPAERRIVARGGLFTAREAQDLVERLWADAGQRFKPVVVGGPMKVGAKTREIIREDLQNPAAMESLGQQLLNDRVLNPSAEGFDARARNVGLMPQDIFDRLDRHLAPAGSAQRFLQFLNKPFRLAVLPQPRWLTGNFAEPYLIRLSVTGSGLVNIPGLALDIRATTRYLGHLERSGDPRMRQYAKDLRAQHLGGLFIGNRGATVQRTFEEVLPPGMQRQYARMVARMPVTEQLANLAHTSVRFLGAPLRAFIHANRAIEGVAQRAQLGRQIRQDIREFTGSYMETVRQTPKVLDELAKGSMNTPTFERWLHSQWETLGQYDSFPPAIRELTQGIAPFLPWAMAAARFVFWTMPAHHTIATALLVKTSQVVQKDWELAHKSVNAPPGELQLAPIQSDKGLVDLARYTPYGFTAPLAAGDFQGAVQEFVPQLQGALQAVQGKDPFGRDLRLAPTKGNPTGAPSGLDKLLIALNSLFEATVPYSGYARRLQEHGATPYANSYLLSPKTKPGTSHGMGALERVFDPFRATYLSRGQDAGSTSPVPGNTPQGVLARARGHVRVNPDAKAAQEILARSRSGR